jgi:hypothetical protein
VKSNRQLKALLVVSVFFLRFCGLAYAQSATGISGLYYTGANNSGGLLAGATQDSHWSVSYARVAGVSGNATYQGAAYVVNSGNVYPGWVPNTATAQWITAPGASTAATGGTINTGGDYLPGNGTTGTNSGYYVYKLAFTIAGSGAAGTTVTNQVSINLTIAADNQYAVYMNPASAPTVDNAGVISAGGTAATSGWVTTAWDNTNSLTMRNYGGGGSNNARFVIGTNYLYVVVANTLSNTGTQAANTLNPSGMLVYQVGTAMTIDGNPVVPEVGAWLPVVLALGLFARKRFSKFDFALLMTPLLKCRGQTKPQTITS